MNETKNNMHNSNETKTNIRSSNETLPNTRYSGETLPNERGMNTQPSPFSTDDIVFGKYRVLSLINEGGESYIYKAEYNKQYYVLKCYKYNKIFDKDVYDLLKTKTNNHCNLIKLYEYGYHNNVSVEVLEYMNGDSLEDMDKDPMEDPEYKLCRIRRFVELIISGLQTLHKAGIYYNDLKPSNILYDKGNRRIALCDYSLCCVCDAGSTLIQHADRGKLTPGFSSPEFNIGISSAAGDMFSVGVLIYTLFYNRPPFLNFDLEDWELSLFRQDQFLPVDAPSELYIVNDLVRYNAEERASLKEVKKWCSGEYVSTSTLKNKKGTFSYRLNGIDCYDRKSLRSALALNWEEGLRRTITTKELFESFINNEQDIASMAKIASSESEAFSPDVAFMRFLYNLFPEDKRFVWKGKIYNDTQTLSEQMLSRLRSNDEAFVEELLRNNVLSIYFGCIGLTDQAQSLYAIELAYDKSLKGKIGMPVTPLSLAFALAFLLNTDKKVMTNGTLYSESSLRDNLGMLSKYLFDVNGYPAAEFCGYLIATDRQKI